MAADPQRGGFPSPFEASSLRAYEGCEEMHAYHALSEDRCAFDDGRFWFQPSSRDSVDDRRLEGFAASPGVVDGVARVVLRHDRLGALQEGEILVAPSASTSLTPVFGTIAAAVFDSGGIMCNAATVAREYGLPIVIGARTATKRIKTGDRLRVDADSGVVEILA